MTRYECRAACCYDGESFEPCVVIIPGDDMNNPHRCVSDDSDNSADFKEVGE